MEGNELIKYEGSLIKRVGNAITITNKMVSLTEPQLIPYRKKDKWGYCTADKRVMIDCIYFYAERFRNGQAQVRRNETEYGYIDKNGHIITDFTEGTLLRPFTSFKLQAFKNKRLPRRDDMIVFFKKNEKFGFIDKDGIEIIAPKYDRADEFYEGLALIQIENNLGYINKQGLEYWED